MAGGFDNGVATPGGAGYTAPLLNFANFGDWAQDYQRGVSNSQQQGLNDQTKQLNQQRLTQGQQQIDLAGAFTGGLPKDAQGNIDYGKAAQILAQKGDIGSAISLLQQQTPAQSPMLTGGGQPPPAGPAPASVPAAPLPAPAASKPQGDAGNGGTVTDLVTDRLPQQDQTTGQTISKIAQMLGVEPNAQLTPGQLRRAQGLLAKYAPADSSASGGAGGTLPPSANAVSPAPKVTAPPARSAAPIGAGSPQPQGAPVPQPAPVQPQPQPAPVQPQQPQGGPITPQVPLPKGFNDPQKAMLALRAEAARLSSNPRAAGQVKALNDWATSIEASIAPVDVSPNTTRVDPRTGKILYQGAAAAAYANPEAAATLDADAARYRQTGTLPPNMGRGVQGQQQATAIRTRAAEQEINAGGDPQQWPSRWQDYKATGVGKSTAERVKANREENLNLILKAADAAIPAALEASKALPRGQYVPLNKLIQKGEIMSSDPRLVEFGMANLQLAEHWARAMNPTGVMRESDRDKALMFLDTGYSNNTYERAVMQLQKQITRERDAVRGGGTILKDNKAPVPGEDSGTTPGGVKWKVEQ